MWQEIPNIIKLIHLKIKKNLSLASNPIVLSPALRHNYQFIVHLLGTNSGSWFLKAFVELYSTFPLK